MDHITYFDLREVAKRMPRPACRPGWYPAAYGGAKAAHFTSDAHLARAKAVHRTEQPAMSESHFEDCVELSILLDLPGPRMTFMELGAGWGGQSLNLHTAVKNRAVDTAVQEVYCYAVEPEPGHYGFLVEAFRENGILGLPIYGATTSTLGWASFYAEQPPNHNYGQSLHPRGNITVPTFTVANLVETFKIEEVDLVHMDVQGAEPETLLGAQGVIERFRFLIVCPHYEEHMASISDLLRLTHNLIVSFGPRSGYHELEGFPLPIHMPQDGIMVWERK